jgi:SAM-dependent methyltransferase
VLDVGCGIGLTDQLLVDGVGVVHGIGLSAESVARASALNPSARYTAFRRVRFPLDAATVDFAFAIAVLHHAPPQGEHFAREVRRAVKPGGIVAVLEHDPLDPATRFAVRRCELDDPVLVGRRHTEQLLESACLPGDDGAPSSSRERSPAGHTRIAATGVRPAPSATSPHAVAVTIECRRGDPDRAQL